MTYIFSVMTVLRALSYARSETLLGFSVIILYMERVVGENGTGSEFHRVFQGFYANHHFDNDLYSPITTPDKCIILQT
jgi:hypothetical protein